jgi:glutamine---fructose-6-phosphate transaminase (isomerizing)
MCGIVGFIGKSGSVQLLVDSLQRLEYRGYDSAGIAFLNGRGLEIYKTKGRLMDLQKILPDPSPRVKLGLGHTRWATHGAPSAANAHPHSVNGVAVVHNGIIENYRELRTKLELKGRQFLSETDTEVVPQLISDFMLSGHSIRDAVRAAAAQLRGTYALGIICESCPDMLFAVRKGSPLVIGISNDTYYFASDLPAILPYTRKFIFMEDGHFCTLTENSILMHHLESDSFVSLQNSVEEIDWSPVMAEKGGHGHFMHKEIYEQPQAIRNTFGERLDDPLNFVSNLKLYLQRKEDIRRLHIVSCGTSYHAGLIGKYMIERIARMPVSVDTASEYRYRSPIIDSDTLFIAITQSGETADTLAAQREAKRLGAQTLTICNVVGSTSTREADAVLYTRSGPEISVASTKTFTSQLAALLLLALGIGYGRHSMNQDELDDLRAHIAEIPSLVERTLLKDAEIRELAGTLVHARDFLYLARGINYPMALEGALKLKEISYIHAEGYPAGEMKHGPIALIEKGLPVVVMAPSNDLFDKMFSNIEEIKARGGRIIAITDAPALLRDKADDIIEVPAIHPLLSPFMYAVPLQLLAYHVGVLRGCDVDQPRNLAKSVTVE